MSYKVLSLNTRNKIVQLNHEALQRIHFSLHISLCHYLAPASLEAKASHSQHIPSLAAKTTKPAKLTSAFLRAELSVGTAQPFTTKQL